MISAINSAISGMLVQQRKVEVAANNVANSETDGFEKSRVTAENVEPQGVRVTGIDKVTTPGPLVLEETAEGSQFVEKSNVEMAEELPATMIARRYYEANIKVIQTEDAMLGSLLDIKG